MLNFRSGGPPASPWLSGGKGRFMGAGGCEMGKLGTMGESEACEKFEGVIGVCDAVPANGDGFEV